MSRLNPKRWLWPRTFPLWAWPIVAIGTSFVVVGTLMLAMRAILWAVLNYWGV